MPRLPTGERGATLAAIVVAALLPAAGDAETRVLPRWELGVGAGALYAPDYVGSDEYRTVASPFPYGAYRGDRWRVDRGGIRNKLFGTEQAKLDLSFGFALPLRSDDNDARAGMPDLDLIIEVGPSVELLVAETQGGYGKLWVDTPLRAAFRVDRDDFGHQGWVFQPRARYRVDRPTARGYWSTQVSGSLLFADQRFQNYFYGVPPEFARPGREPFTADGGYNGFRLAFSATRRIDRLWLGVFLRYDDLSGSSVTDSPLVTAERSYLLGVSAAWIVSQSKD